MSSLIVEVCKVDKIEKHPNADKLSIVQVKGWNCIVGLDQYKEGDKVVYIPPDAIIPPTLIEQYNLTYLKNGGRTGTVKLRGYISQGLILDTPDGYNVGDNVADALGITKYEPPEPKYQSNVKGQKPSKKKLNPAFDKYTDIENVKHYNTIFQEDDDVVITEKIHGCLQKKTKILLADGTSKTIGEIVKNKLPVEVLGMNNKGEIVPTKITNWFINGKTDEWYKIKYKRRGYGTLGNWYGSLICTPNHQIYINGNYVHASNLHVGDKVTLIKDIKELTYLQESILTGIMLGDGSFEKQNIHSASIHFEHKKEHETYVDYIMNSLGSISGNKQKERLSGFGTTICRGRTINLPSIYDKFIDWYKNDKKQVPDNIILNPISLAFWYMDDGSLSLHEGQEDRAIFATCNFNECSIDNLLKAMSMLNIIGEKYLSENKYWRIRLNAKEAEKLFILIAPYICEIMQYKLPDRFKHNMNNFMLNNDITNYHHLLIEQEIISIETEKLDKKSKEKYDIETETHNFFADGILVHNSNARYGNLPICTNHPNPFKRLWNRIKAKFSNGYEFVYGSHNVQITFHTNRQSFYGDDVWGIIGKKYNMKDIIPKDHIIYGEIYGKGIQDLEYGLGDIDFVVFAIKVNGQYQDWSYVQNFCKERGLFTVPVLYVGKWTPDLLAKYTDGKSTLCPWQIREGCVVCSWHETNDPRIGRKILKSVSNDYLTRANGTEYH